MYYYRCLLQFITGFCIILGVTLQCWISSPMYPFLLSMESNTSREKQTIRPAASASNLWSERDMSLVQPCYMLPHSTLPKTYRLLHFNAFEIKMNISICGSVCHQDKRCGIRTCPHSWDSALLWGSSLSAQSRYPGRIIWRKILSPASGLKTFH